MRPNRIFILISCFHPFNSLCDVVKWGEKKAKKSSPPFSSSLSLAHTAGSAKPETSVAGRIFTFHRKSGRKGKVSSMCCRKQLQALLRGALSISSSGQWQLLPPFQPGHQQHPAQPGPPPMGSLFPSLSQSIPVSAAALGPAQGASLWEKEGMQQDKPKSIATAASAPC